MTLKEALRDLWAWLNPSGKCEICNDRPSTSIIEVQGRGTPICDRCRKIYTGESE